MNVNDFYSYWFEQGRQDFKKEVYYNISNYMSFFSARQNFESANYSIMLNAWRAGWKYECPVKWRTEEIVDGRGTPIAIKYVVESGKLDMQFINDQYYDSAYMFIEYLVVGHDYLYLSDHYQNQIWVIDEREF